MVQNSIPDQALADWILQKERVDLLNEIFNRHASFQKVLQQLLFDAFYRQDREAAQYLWTSFAPDLTQVQLAELILADAAGHPILPLIAALLGPLSKYETLIQTLFETSISQGNETLALVIFKSLTVKASLLLLLDVDKQFGRQGPLWKALFPPGSEEPQLQYTYFKAAGLMERF